MQIDQKKLRAELARQGISQTMLAKAAGLSRMTVSYICRGAACKTETGLKIAEALGVPLHKLEQGRR